LYAGVASPVEDLTDFLRRKLLERLIAPAVYVSSLVWIVFQGDIRLIGGPPYILYPIHMPLLSRNTPILARMP
jgi:hypothetical protein